MIDYSGFKFSKPAKRKKAAARKTRDGREVLNLNSAAGRKEYKIRIAMAWVKQKGRCALCKRPMSLEEATFDHILPRGMGGGSRDDSEKNCQATHILCNVARGSKRIA